MSYDRDLIGYGANPPNPRWPGDARIAINFVMNYEEGSEPSIQDGEDFTETGLTEAHGLNQGVPGRDLAGEGMFAYGSRVGFWRLMRLFQERNLPMTIFGCALAIERNPKPPPRSALRASIAAAMAGAGSSITSSARRRSASISGWRLNRSRRPWASVRLAGIAAMGRA